MLGKTNTPTLGWVGVTDNLLFGATRNPWSLGHTPGGSSGGAGAAVAAGLGPLPRHRRRRIDSQAGRLVRDLRPQGLVGTDSRPSARRGVEPLARRADDAHREGRRAHDERVAGPDERDQYSLPADAVDYVKALKGNLKGLRVAWSEKLGVAPAVDPEVGAATREGRARVPRARLQGRERRAHVAVAVRLLAHDLPRRHRRAPGALPRPPRPDRSGPACRSSRRRMSCRRRSTSRRGSTVSPGGSTRGRSSSATISCSRRPSPARRFPSASSTRTRSAA